MSSLLEIQEKNFHFLLQSGKIFLSSARRAVETERLILKFWNICVLFRSQPGKFCLFMFRIILCFMYSAELVLHPWPAKNI